MCSRQQRSCPTLRESLLKNGFDVNDTNASLRSIKNATRASMRGLSEYTLSSCVTFLSRLRKEMAGMGFSAKQIAATRMPLQTRKKNKEDVTKRKKKNEGAFEIPSWLTQEYVEEALRTMIEEHGHVKRPTYLQVACLQLALCARVTELITGKLEFRGDKLYMSGCLKGDPSTWHELVSCVPLSVVYGAFKNWETYTPSVKASCIRQRNYNDKLKAHSGVTSHRLRSIGGHMAIEVANPPTLSTKINLLGKALRHSSTSASMHSYADVKRMSSV